MLADLKLPPITFKKATHYTYGRSEPVRAFVNHRMVGTLIGTDAYFTNPTLTTKVSTHFGIGHRNGKVAITQYVPLDDTAYGNGNYDSSGNWDNWGYKTTEVNPQTISIEHQDHWGVDALKGIVPDDVQAASIALQALIRYGTLAEWKQAGIMLRNWTTNGPILQREIKAIPIDGRRVITHNDIAGRLKPYCWKPWMKDTIGFPREKYVAGIIEGGKTLAYVAPPPTVTILTAEYEALKAELQAQATLIANLTTQNVNLQTTLDLQSAALNTASTLVGQLDALLKTV